MYKIILADSWSIYGNKEPGKDPKAVNCARTAGGG